MLLLSHIFVACVSIVISSLALIKPSKQKIAAAYSLASLTLISGTWLFMQKPQHLTTACLEGVIYLTVVFSLNFFAYKKLVQVKA